MSGKTSFENITLCDIVRYAVTCFEKAELSYGHGTAGAFDEACFLVCETLKLEPGQIETFWNARLLGTEAKALLTLIDRRVTTRKPAAYLLNTAYSQGYKFYVDERVIVPRSYIAEILCGEVSPVPDEMPVRRILDLCTGSGTLAVIAADLFPDAAVDAVDLSPDALEVARRNVGDYGLEDRITLYHGNLYDPLPKGVRYDLILTNPPYVDKPGMDTLPPEYDAEPKMALDGGADGLDLVHVILARAADYLAEDGLMICEVGYAGATLAEAYADTSFTWLETENSVREVFFMTREELGNLSSR